MSDTHRLSIGRFFLFPCSKAFFWNSIHSSQVRINNTSDITLYVVIITTSQSAKKTEEDWDERLVSSSVHIKSAKLISVYLVFLSSWMRLGGRNGPFLGWPQVQAYTYLWKKYIMDDDAKNHIQLRSWPLYSLFHSNPSAQVDIHK